MHKIIIFFLLTCLTVVYGNEKVEIFATRVNSKGDIIHSSGGVAVAYKDYYLTASRAIYDKSTGELELFHDVRANQNDEYKILGNYAKLNIKNKERSFQPFYMLEKESQVWLSADKNEQNDKDLKISSGVVSSCEPINPMWQMEFTSSDYNLDSKWLNLYNTTLYIYDIPVFYTPWFGYPLDRTRRTGLITPEFGYSRNEGFFYKQPIYIAEDDWWDLEFDPQIRSQRGAGIYSTFRFADSEVSRGEFTLGYFKEKSSYYQEYNLDRESHNGWNFKYDNSDFLTQWFGLNLEGESGLYVDANYMSDVDYINLASSNTIETSTATQVLSRINMYYNTENDYFGAYFKYYQDLTLEDNDNTLQKLPTIQYHHYLETLLDNHLLYNVDIQSQNIYREINTKAIQTDINIPVAFHTSVLDEYMDLSITTNLHGQHTSFNGSPQDIRRTRPEDGHIMKNNYILDASTQLTKAYQDFSHVISFGASYTFQGGETSDGYYKNNKHICQNDATKNSEICEFFGIDEEEDDEYEFDFTQYIYDESGKQLLYHRISQVIKDRSNNKLGDLENEFEYKVTDNLTLYNDLRYNHDEQHISKSYTKLSYNDYGVTLSLSHLYEDTFLRKTIDYTPITNYITSSIRYDYDEHYTFYGAYDYDSELDVKKRLEYGYLYKKRCWDFGLKYVENNRPILRKGGHIDNIRDKYIYLSLALKPFMSSESSFFAFKLPNDGEERR
jgi:LPS-assembly protein